MWPCHSVYRETARVERTISLLDFLTAPATISNKEREKDRQIYMGKERAYSAKPSISSGDRFGHHCRS
jgi:hypothetical protein